MLKKYWKQTFEDEKTETEIFIARFFLLFNVLVFLAIVITAIVALGILHRPERASIIIILGAIVVINFGAIFIHKQIKYGAMILSFALCIILAYLMGSFNVSENSPTWTIVAIVVIMYLLGKHWGTQLSLFFIGAQIFCYIVLNDKTHYPASPFVLSVFSQIITIGLLYFYLQFNEQKDNKIIEAKKQLEEEIRAKNTVVTQLDSTITNLQAQSTDIEQNKFGDWGHSEWRDVKPKTINDKIYLVLKNNGKPMHYQDIGKMINETGFDGKSVNTATVHNELILDDKYVLVGRGLYALKEWGYTKGTVADIIADILEKINGYKD